MQLQQFFRVRIIATLNSLWNTVYMMGFAKELMRVIHCTMAMVNAEGGGQDAMNDRHT